MAGTEGFARPPGMTALVRWTTTHVCLEAIEIGYRSIPTPTPAHVMLVGRFVGEGASAALTALTETDEYKET